MNRRLILFSRLTLPLVFVIVIVFVFYQVVFGDVFRVTKVMIEADPEIFHELSLLRQKRHLLFTSTQKLANTIVNTYPWVETVEINKLFPHTLVIHVKERVPALILFRKNERILIDGQGKLLPQRKIFESQQFTRLQCPVVEETGHLISDASIVYGVQIVSDLRQDELTLPLELICLDSSTQKTKFIETEVIYSTLHSPEEVTASLQFLFKQFRIEGTWPKVVDLRFEKPVLVVDSTTSTTESATPAGNKIEQD